MPTAMEWRTLLATGLLAYVFGSVPWGYLIGRFNGLDLRRHGSGNIGATNVRRVLGRDWGLLCFGLDFLKGLVPVLMALALAGTRRGDMPAGALAVTAAAAAVVGHAWPFTLRFRGGKGVATSIGALLALAPWSVLAALIVWYAVFSASRYVSVASICAAVVLPLSALLQRVWTESPSALTVGLLVGIAALIVYRHRSNMLRLWQGTENRFAPKRRRVPRAPAPEPPSES